MIKLTLRPTALPLLLLCLLPGWLCPVTAAPVTTPKQFFGASIGDDYFLADYRQLTNYWIQLAHESPRLRVVPIGRTEEGRVQMMGIVTSAANQQRLARYQDIARQLATAVPGDPDVAQALSREGKAVVWIDGGLHASEVLGAQQLIETLYQFVSGNDPETLRILDDVIILFVHANPDGMDLCSQWYMKETDPHKRTLNGLPRLYQKYIGHDNNRDFYAATQAETRNLNRVMYREWFPQIVYNHHQTGPPGTVLFCPPFRDPFNYNVNPLVISGIDALGAAMMQRFLEEDKPGATVRSGTRYSTWWNGGLRTTCYFHNMIGLLTESIGSPTPMQIPFNPALQLPKADYLAPIAPQTWHFRQSIDYSVSANKAVLDYASRHRQPLLFDIWRMGHAAVERGNRDSWTITPKLVEAARAGRVGGTAAAEHEPEPPAVASSLPPESATPTDAPAPRGRGGRGARAGGDGSRGTNQFNRLFRDPANRDPRGYIIPADQPDFPTATKFVNALLSTGITVERATTEFTIGDRHYPAGSYAVLAAQPFRAHVLDQFEPQDHPNDFPYPGAAPTPPYDISGWTLADQMGVQFDRIRHGFDGPFAVVNGPIAPAPAGIVNAEGAVGYYLGTRINDAFRIVNRLLAAGQPVRRLREAVTLDAITYPPGTFYLERQPATEALLQKLAQNFGVPFTGTRQPPAAAVAADLHPVRIGLWDRYGGSIPSGWTRWLLEQFEYPFELVYAPELDRGDLRAKFDVLIFVDGAIPGRTGSVTIRAPGDGGDAPAAGNPEAPATGDAAKDEYREQRGSLTAEKTVPQLRQFLTNGGTVLTIGTSTSLAYHLDLPLTNGLVETGTNGRVRALSREKFYIPGSLLQVAVNPATPLTWGLDPTASVMFIASSPAFRLLDGAATNGLARVAWFDTKTPLRSGWAWGQEYLQDTVAIAEARVGAGHLALFGPEILFRAQPHGTFKFLFNAILQAGLPPAATEPVASAKAVTN